MRVQLSLKWFISLSLLAIGGVLVVGYSLLTAQYFIRGMDNIVASHMEQAGIAYLAHSEATEAGGEYNGYYVARRWEGLPLAIRQAFGQPPSQVGVLLKHDDSGWLQRPSQLHFLLRLHLRRSGETLFVAQTNSAAKVSRMVVHNMVSSRQALLLISLFSAVALALIIWLLLRRVSRPMAALVAWTRALQVEQLDQPPPDFAYPELNQLAELIRTSLSSVQQALAREHRFLRHASHELRTPISVIRNNIELLHKLQQQAVEPLAPRQAQIVDRIDRASLTMRHLTETLLWLSREATEPLAQREVALDQLLRQLVEEMSYLLADKPVTLTLETSAWRLQLPDAAARIVLGNLIRNAFQHTWSGRVVIQQQRQRVVITNQAAESGPPETEGESGFGLGLQLTERLTARLGWPYSNQLLAGGRQVTLEIAPAAEGRGE